MELNNTIDPSTGLPKLPKDMYWEITEPTSKSLPRIVLMRKVVSKEYIRSRANPFMRLLGISHTSKSKPVSREIAVLGRALGVSSETAPRNTKGWFRYNYYDNVSEMPKNGIRYRTFWMKCDISKKNILKQSSEMWDEHIEGAHDLAIIMNICGKYPPNKI